MSEECLIDARGLSKKFSLSLRQSMNNGLKDSFRQLFRLQVHSGELRREEFWAVNDVSFQLRRGDCLGVMGANGSGKTTLLRILNGIYAPDAGEVTLRGRVGALIAAGAGFSPVLTGRENIYVNGALLGMSRQQLHRQMDEIIDFAEIGDFIDSPVRHYSSGMQVRLGFAVAAVARPDILIVDEVLAVGDMNFQKKCSEYLHRIKRDGTAIVLVSHSVGAIWSLCDRGLYLEKGRALVDGSIDDVLQAYKQGAEKNHFEPSATQASQVAQPAPEQAPLKPTYEGRSGGTGDVIVRNTRMVDLRTGHSLTELNSDEGFLLEAEMEIRNPLVEPIIRYSIDASRYRFIVILDSQEAGLTPGLVQPGMYRIQVRVPQQNLRPGPYVINVAALKRDIGVHLYYSFDVCRFVVRQPADRMLTEDDSAVMHLDSQFQVIAMPRALTGLSA